MAEQKECPWHGEVLDEDGDCWVCEEEDDAEYNSFLEELEEDDEDDELDYDDFEDEEELDLDESLLPEEIEEDQHKCGN